MPAVAADETVLSADEAVMWVSAPKLRRAVIARREAALGAPTVPLAEPYRPRRRYPSSLTLRQALSLLRDRDYQAARAVEGALAVLPPVARALLVLRYERGLSWKAMAAVTGLPLPAVKANVRAALEALHREAARRLEEALVLGGVRP
jgi:DNA-directed RNA polymerase specialized sigma24 family protein